MVNGPEKTCAKLLQISPIMNWKYIQVLEMSGPKYMHKWKGPQYLQMQSVWPNTFACGYSVNSSCFAKIFPNKNIKATPIVCLQKSNK